MRGFTSTACQKRRVEQVHNNSSSSLVTENHQRTDVYFPAHSIVKWYPAGNSNVIDMHSNMLDTAICWACLICWTDLLCGYRINIDPSKTRAPVYPGSQ